MAGYDDRLMALRQLVDAATDTLEKDVPAQTWEQYEEGFDRMSEVLAYAATALAYSEAVLVPPEAVSEMEGALNAFRERCATEAQSVESWASQVLHALAKMPVPRGQDTAQEAKDAASTLRQSIGGHLSGLHTDIRSAQDTIEELGQTLATRSGEIDQAMAERRAEADRIVSEMQAAIEEAKSRVQSVETEQAETFREAQDQRATAFQTVIEEQRSDSDEQAGQRDSKAEEFLERMRRREEETRQLVKAIGEYGTGGRYALEVKDQKKQANLWRWITVGVALGAVAAAVWAATTDGNIDDARVASKLLIGLVFAGLAGYTAKQSGRHRQREEHAKGLELDMAVFPVLIDSMDAEKQQAAREKVLDNSINRPLTRGQEADGGPGVLDAVRDLVNRDGGGGG